MLDGIPLDVSEENETYLSFLFFLFFQAQKMLDGIPLDMSEENETYLSFLFFSFSFLCSGSEDA